VDRAATVLSLPAGHGFTNRFTFSLQRPGVRISGSGERRRDGTWIASASLDTAANPALFVAELLIGHSQARLALVRPSRRPASYRIGDLLHRYVS
jgi:hypothetical protein